MYIRPCLVCGKLMEGVYDKRVKYHPQCTPFCKMEGCERKFYHIGSGLCQKHYMRWRRGKPETNPCKGCGTMIDSRYKWCPNCKALHLDTRGRRNVSLKNKSLIKEQKLQEEIEKRKKKLFGTDKIRGHVVESERYFDKPVSKINSLEELEEVCF